jgi:hypothetical protein
MVRSDVDPARGDGLAMLGLGSAESDPTEALLNPDAPLNTYEFLLIKKRSRDVIYIAHNMSDDAAKFFLHHSTDSEEFVLHSRRLSVREALTSTHCNVVQRQRGCHSRALACSPRFDDREATHAAK